MTSFDEIIGKAKRPETAVSLCLRGDLDAEWRLLSVKLESASRSTSSLGDRSEASVLAEQIRAIETEMRDSTIAFRLRAESAKAWSDFAATRPRPADDRNEADLQAATFGWICELVARSAIDPVMTAGQVAELCDVLSAAQWDELSNAAWSLNNAAVAVPFSLAASALIPSDERK